MGHGIPLAGRTCTVRDDVGTISVAAESTPTPAIALPADAFAKQLMPWSSTDWRAFSVEREHIINRQGGEAAGSAITVQKLNFEPIWREQLHHCTNIADFDINVGRTLQNCDKV
jgi:hypothetical protein